MAEIYDRYANPCFISPFLAQLSTKIYGSKWQIHKGEIKTLHREKTADLLDSEEMGKMENDLWAMLHADFSSPKALMITAGNILLSAKQETKVQSNLTDFIRLWVQLFVTQVSFDTEFKKLREFCIKWDLNHK